MNGLSKCQWCLRRAANSGWEQMSVTRGWLRLCNRCANKRLRNNVFNPFRSFIQMRRVEQAKDVLKGMAQ